MGAVKITDGIYSVGVLNPNLRVFDIIMKTDYGTSYNAYLVKGSEKIALIETCHAKYFDEYEEYINSVIGDEKVDYIVLNHCEPDHSGALLKIADKYPDVEIVVTMAGSNNVKNIINRDAKIRVVKQGDKIDLGGKTLEFIPAMLLHWPDTMFTYIKEDKVLFSCDFLGSHYCEPRVFDKYVTYKEAYESALLGYYLAIFGPFKPYVLEGLEKIKDLEKDFICTSHGPVLTKETMDDVMAKYKEWSTPVKKDKKEIPIFYCSAYGATREIAKNIAKGINNVIKDADVQCFDIIKHDMGDLAGKLASSDAFLIGTPTLNRDAVAPVWNLLSHIDAINIINRPCAVFGSYGWSGEGCGNVSQRLKSLRAKVSDEMLKILLIPSEKQLEEAVVFGENFAKTLI